jgi:hypothetical protein
MQKLSERTANSILRHLRENLTFSLVSQDAEAV